MGYRRSRGRRRDFERRFERAAYALILGLLLITLIMPGLRADFVTLAAGAILTGSAVVQSSRGWRVNPLTWIGGILLLIIGFLNWQTDAIPGGIAFPLLVMGGVLLLSVLNGDL